MYYLGARTFRQAGQVWAHLLFLQGRSPCKNACWGAPQTRRTSGHFVQKSYCLRPVAIAPGPYFPARPGSRAGDPRLP